VKTSYEENVKIMIIFLIHFCTRGSQKVMPAFYLMHSFFIGLTIPPVKSLNILSCTETMSSGTVHACRGSEADFHS
jgi:hypothetical protein